MTTTTVPEAGPGHRAEVHGRAAGVTVLGFFAFAWMGWGTGALLSAAAEVIVMVAAFLLSVALVITAVRIRRQLPAGSPQTRAGRADVGRTFGLIVLAEWIVLGVAAGGLGATGHAQFIPAVVAFGVGLHFFPLAVLFRLPFYHLTGALLCAVAVAAVILAPATGVDALWASVPGIGSAGILWATCLVLLTQMRGMVAAEQARVRK